MQRCPKCESIEIHRSRSRSTWELVWKTLTRKRTYRCGTCGWRGWGVESGRRFTVDEQAQARSAVATDPIDWNGGDVLEPTPARPPLSMDDLKGLDLKARS